MQNTNEIATIQQNNEVAKTETRFQTVDLNAQLPDLSKAKETVFDLMSDYWTPVNDNECKRVVFVKIENSPMVDQKTGEIIDLDCAFFLEQVQNDVKMIRNASRRLVGSIQGANLQPGTPLLITWTGKKRFRNGNTGDNWSVKPLIING